MWREFFNARLARGVFHDFSENLRRHAISPDSAGFVDRPEHAAFCDLRCLGPVINGLLHPHGKASTCFGVFRFFRDLDIDDGLLNRRLNDVLRSLLRRSGTALDWEGI